MSLAYDLLRPHLRDMTPYASARRSMSGGNIWLNANESPYSGDYSVETSQLNRYPNFQSTDLNTAYAKYAGVQTNQLLSHRGSDESIELLIRSFCEPGRDRIMICPPTYGMYAISAQINNTPVVRVPLRSDNWQLDIDAMAAAREQVKVVFVCNPNNPIGNALKLEDVQQVLELFAEQALVVVDEAYIEFAESTSFAALINEYPNLVVMRTLSKAFGLAGIRVGFTLANADIIQTLVPVLAPYPLPDLSIQVATQALGTDNLIQVRQNVIEAQGERARVHQALTQFSFVRQVEPSQTNFILFQVDDADAVMQHCQQGGILIRNQSAQLGLSNCLRVTIGAPAENDAFLEQLSTFGAVA
jgi:histidinol-phosphate aminotransferase